MEHREVTKGQSERVQSILEKHGAKADAHTDQATQALVKETRKMLRMLKGNDLRDAGLIASALEHYEIAAHGTARHLPASLTCAMTNECFTAASKKKEKPMRSLRNWPGRSKSNMRVPHSFASIKKSRETRGPDDVVRVSRVALLGNSIGWLQPGQFTLGETQDRFLAVSQPQPAIDFQNPAIVIVVL
jgi:hypothetical protein